MNDDTPPSAMPHATRRATLRDVARLSGVSEISVSRVMRGSPAVSDALRNKVMSAANQLAYTPNRLAGALKTQSSNLVAVVVPSMGNGVFPEVLDGIESVLTKAGLQPVMGITQYDRTREISVLRDMLAWSPMGVIIAGTDHDPAIAAMLAQHRIPVVECMDIDGTPIQAAVGISHVRAAQDVADLLYARGYRKPGYVGAWGERPDRSRTRRQAFETRLQELGMPLVDKVIAAASATSKVGAESTAKLLARSPEIDVIFYANDDQALGGLFYCMRSGRNVPDDVGLIGFNGIELGLTTPIALASVETPRYQMGVETAHLLLAGTETTRNLQIIDLGYNVRMGESL